MVLRTHQRQACTMTNNKTISHFSSHLPILKVRPSSTPAWTNQSTSRPRTTRAQEATESTLEFHGTAVHLVITTMNLLLMSRASNFNKCLAAPTRLRLPTINKLAQANGTFHLIILIIPISILLIIIQRLHTRTTAVITSKTLWVRWIWINSSWTITACSKTTITTTVSVDRSAEHFCQQDFRLAVSLVSLDQVRFSCGSSYLNFSPINRVKVSSHGLAMAGNSS